MVRTANTDVLTVDLVRHARSVSNITATYCNDLNDPLAPDAHADIDRLRDHLAHVHYTACFSSPYRRCIDTARGLLGSRPIEPKVETSLREIEQGPWDSLTVDQVRREYPSQWELWNRSPNSLSVPGRETLDAVRVRAGDWLDGVVRVVRRGHVLAVTHVAVIRVLVAIHLALPMSLVRTIDVPNLALFRLELRQAGSTIWQLQLPKHPS